MPLPGSHVSCRINRQELDGDRALEAGVGSLVDDAHPAAAQLRDDLIRTELSAGDQGHRRGRL